MKKFMQKRLKNEKGMTLIELLAVIVILAIIAAIAIPAIGNIIENSRYNAVKSDALNILSAAKIYSAENEVTVTIEKDDLDSYIENHGQFDAITYTIAKNGDGDLSLTATEVPTGNGNQKISFSNASVKDINDDPQKGSDGELTTITGTAVTTP
ncbi:prepilin-type N-terminal cleavage/methylation domain-containing protein [Planococcus sp. CAU13]|uniref:prepilin-type N-terminal cleavage/methylation domain-containing protein n=1 Tax=Planococcus sp. CAU13 TaxID=1541197 RepID=UPI00052FF684|nr:prepilin-type N-terminal cleavage/methylation domain-containing protein [Planococcus sp. CAU13]